MGGILYCFSFLSYLLSGAVASDGDAAAVRSVHGGHRILGEPDLSGGGDRGLRVTEDLAQGWPRGWPRLQQPGPRPPHSPGAARRRRHVPMSRAGRGGQRPSFCPAGVGL